MSVCCVLREGVNKVTDITEGRNRRCFQHLALYLPLRLQRHMNIIHNLEREREINNRRVVPIFMISIEVLLLFLSSYLWKKIKTIQLG